MNDIIGAAEDGPVYSPSSLRRYPRPRAIPGAIATPNLHPVSGQAVTVIAQVTVVAMASVLFRHVGGVNKTPGGDARVPKIRTWPIPAGWIKAVSWSTGTFDHISACALSA